MKMNYFDPEITVKEFEGENIVTEVSGNVTVGDPTKEKPQGVSIKDLKWSDFEIVL